MINKDKTIYRLGLIKKWAEDGIHWDGIQGTGCLNDIVSWMDDAMSLLKRERRSFTVVDRLTGEYPNIEEIALNEEWAKGLIYCDMEGFAIEEDGTLLLLDECGNQRMCPHDRFEVIWEYEM